MRGATGEGTMGRGQRSLHEFCMQCEAEFCRMLTCVWHALLLAEARAGGTLARIPPGQGSGERGKGIKGKGETETKAMDRTIQNNSK